MSTLTSALHRAQGSVPVQRQLGRYRRLRSRLVNAPMKQVELARRRLGSEEVDVLLLGDSSTLCWALTDSDRRRIPELLGDRLGNVVAVSGPGFGADIYGEAVRLLATAPQRPRAVVFTLALRTSTSTHILDDPVVGHHRSLEALRRTPHARRRLRYVGAGGATATDAEREAFLDRRIESRWSGVATVRDYRDQIRGLGLPPWPLHLEKVRFDYFYGEVIRPDHPRLPSLTRLAQGLEAYGVPTVGVWTKPPIERGEMHFPGEFEAHVRDELALQNAALQRGWSALPPMLDVDLDDVDFEDSRNATEHFSFTGRVKVADAMAKAVTDTW